MKWVIHEVGHAPKTWFENSIGESSGVNVEETNDRRCTRDYDPERVRRRDDSLRVRATHRAAVWATLIGVACGALIATAHHSPARSAGTVVPVAPRSVIVVGDSLTALNVSTDERSLKAHGIPSWHLDAQTGRSSVLDMPTAYGVLRSGLASIADVKADGYSSSLWIVELGTNDANGLGACGCDQQALVRSRVATITKAIGTDATIGWVTVRNGAHPVASQVWNAALAAAAATNPHMFLIDWYATSNTHPGWFVDGIHPNALGAPALAELIARAAAAHQPPPTPPTTVAITVQGAASAGEQAVRLPLGATASGGLTIADRCGSITAPVGFGSSGASVRSVQCALTLIGRFSGPIDGVFGAATATAVSAFTHYLGLGGSPTVAMSAGHGLGIWNY
jgi:lysophospholipase L1-like esterase